MSATEATLHLLSVIGDKWSKRLEKAQSRFAELLLLEKARRERIGTSAGNPRPHPKGRSPRGWLIDQEQSVALAIYPGGNSIEGVEFRLASNALYSGSQSHASNDRLEIAGRSYLLKLLPSHYFDEGESS